MADLDDPKAWGLSEEAVAEEAQDDPFAQVQKETAAAPAKAKRRAPAVKKAAVKKRVAAK